MAWMLITLDSEKDSKTPDRDDIFSRYGFERKSPKKDLDLPRSTYIGAVNDETEGKAKVEKIWKDLKKEGLKPTRICGGLISDWKIIQKVDA